MNVKFTLKYFNAHIRRLSLKSFEDNGRFGGLGFHGRRDFGGFCAVGLFILGICFREAALFWKRRVEGGMLKGESQLRMW